MSIKNHHIYSDKFILKVLDLTKIDMATDEDKAYRAGKDKNLCEASESLFILNADDITRQKCRAWEDQLRRQEKMEHKIDILTTENESLSQENGTLFQENDILKKLLEANNISYKK